MYTLTDCWFYAHPIVLAAPGLPHPTCQTFFFSVLCAVLRNYILLTLLILYGEGQNYLFHENQPQVRDFRPASSLCWNASCGSRTTSVTVLTLIFQSAGAWVHGDERCTSLRLKAAAMACPLSGKSNINLFYLIRLNHDLFYLQPKFK